MARRETIEQNELLLQDNISGDVLGILYRSPTTSERQTYINKRSVRKGKKYIDNSIACRVAGGKQIITGLREGDFERKDEAGNYVPISTDKNSPHYYEDWPDWMETHCSDILTALAIRVFEVPVVAGVDEDEEEDPQKN